jgi:hypothetical protein
MKQHRVVQPTVRHITIPDSHQRLSPHICRVVTPSTPHYMIPRSAIQQNLSNGMLAETVQPSNHVFSLPTGQAIRSETSTTNNTTVIIMPKMASIVMP